MLGKRLIKSNDAGGGGCTNTVDLYNPFPDGGGVALYQLNGDATDVSGNYDGTATDVTYGTGQFGQAGVFNGSSSKIEIGSVISNISDATDFSFSQWLNFSALPTSGGIMGIWGSSNANLATIRIAIKEVSGNYELSFLRNFNNTYYYSNSYPTISITNNSWYNLVVTYVASTKTVKYFLNGSQVSEFDLDQSAAFTVDGNLTLGAYTTDHPARTFNGSIDQVRIFSRALRPYEVEALYTEEYCTPTIVPSEHFNTVTYTGNGQSNRDISGVGFQPDLVWTKARTSNSYHALIDSVRGGFSELYSNDTLAESTDPNGPRISSFNSDGYSLINSSQFKNTNNVDFVAWCWKAGGAAVTNTDGTITSQVSANTEAGFSVVTFTGNGSTASVGHGLGQKPSIIFTKNRSASEGWFTQQYMYVPSGNAAYGYLNTTAAFTGFTDSLTNDTVMQQGGTNGQNYVSYCFAEVEGFSNFGSYVGTGASGNTVVTGFEPAFVMIKRTDTTSQWLMYDNKRGQDFYLYPNLSAAEGGPDALFQFLENGFQLTGGNADWNASGGSYIYMAFAADPTAVEPTLEDSFNTVLFTPTTSTSPLPVTGVGFQPDLVWAKYRNGVQNHYLFDSIRGGYLLRSNTTDAELTGTEYMQSFDNDGFTTVNNLFNRTETDSVVAWNWKGAEIPAINSNGSIPSVVSANPAAGFSIVSWASTSTTSTIGHGLESTPSIIIMKSRTNAGDWQVYSSAIGATQKLFLNNTNAATSSGVWGNTSPNESVFTSAFNSVGNVIAYCFAEVAGFSKFGSYVGTDGNSVNTISFGFEPAFVMIKRTDSTGNWRMYDNKRDTGTLPFRINHNLAANSSGSEYDGTGDPYGYLFFTSDGIEFPLDYRNVDINGTGTYIYMAFANQF